jgi:Amt family ammonium transporter
VFPVHGVGGILGTMAVGLFASNQLGVFSGFEEIESIAASVGNQAVGVVSVVVYTALLTFIVIKITGFITSGIRVDKDEETQGLDLVLHEESGYKM